MSTIRKRVHQLSCRSSFGLGLFSVLFTLTMLCYLALPAFGSPFRSTLTRPARPLPRPAASPSGTADSGGLQVTGMLSHPKLVVGDEGTIYLTVSITSPQMEQSQSRKPTDFIVVLDRSGSMAESQKLTFAKEALSSMIRRLSPDDRIAVIGFDHSVDTFIPLQPALPEKQSLFEQVIQSIATRGNTNIGSALETARNLVGDPERSKRIILISDGEANAGITDPMGLARIVQQTAAKNAVFSTIGVGLSFNQELLTNLAFTGMGDYSYLQNLAQLEQILTTNLDEARAVYASSSMLELNLSPGTAVLDPAGYPMERISGEANKVLIRTGQILSGRTRSFTLTLHAPTVAKVDALTLADVTLDCDADGRKIRIPLPGSATTVAVLEPERRTEAYSAVNTDLLQQTWSMNNVGMLQKKVAHWLSRGEQQKAADEIGAFNQAIAEDEKNYGVNFNNSAVQKEVQAIQRDLSSAFVGNDAEKREKQNRFSKEIQYQGALKQ